MTVTEALQLRTGDYVITIYGDCLQVLSSSYDHIVLAGENPMYECCPVFRAFELERKIRKEEIV